MKRAVLLALPFAAAAVTGVLSFTAAADGQPTTTTAAPPDELGRALYRTHCTSCHGTDGQGVEGRGPTLADEGEAAVDFVLRTGRMPMADPRTQANRGPVQFNDEEIRALVAYAGAFGDGAAVPEVDVANGDVAAGGKIFRLNCAACHVASLSGAAIGGGRAAPSLMESTPTEIAEATLVGPGAMPVFGEFDDQDRDDLAAYIVALQGRNRVDQLRDFGGVGPVGEGLGAWLLALLPLVALTRWIGSPHQGRDVGANPQVDADGDVI
jgi:ubiquinol-cytochrome c reductase cytochrome c subunit